MRFLMTYTSADTTPPSAEKTAELGRFGEDMIRSGVLVDSGGILPISKGSRVKLAGGKFTVTDGPFPETKELIVGYAIVQVKSKEEAVEVARRFMSIAGDGDGEIRQLVGPGDGPPH
jgi:hypothetical protein